MKTVEKPRRIKSQQAKKKKQEKQKAAKARSVFKHWEAVAVVTLLALMLIQMVYMARYKSATMDEQNHITRGVTYLRTGDFRLARTHPPLINIISALPLILDSDLALPLDDPSWSEANLDNFARAFLWRGNPDSHSIVFRARLPLIALTLLLALTVYSWGRELYGQGAGVLALALAAFDPNLLAHGSLATNDVGLACFTTLSAYTFWRWLSRPTWRRAIIAGLAFGLAQGSKFSAVFLFPALAIMAVTHWLLKPAEERRAKKVIQLTAVVALIAVIAAIVLFALYGFNPGQLTPA